MTPLTIGTVLGSTELTAQEKVVLVAVLHTKKRKFSPMEVRKLVGFTRPTFYRTFKKLVEKGFFREVRTVSGRSGGLYSLADSSRSPERESLSRSPKRFGTYVPVPITKRETAEFIEKHHRHNGWEGHDRVVDKAKFVVGIKLADTNELVGVAVAGHPRARKLQEKEPLTLEIWRLCVKNGHTNAVSFLYGLVRRIAKSMGYQKLITYTLQHEPGSSLRAAGFRPVAEVPPRDWHRPGRPRNSWSTDNQKKKLSRMGKVRWELEL